MKHALLVAVLLFVAMVRPATVAAAVTDKAANGFTSVNAVVVKAGPEQVWHALVADIGKWWNPEHSWSGDAANLSIEPRAGGCFCEALPGGGSVEHLRVVFVQRPKLLVLHGGIGPLQALGVAGAFTFALQARPDGGTQITLTARVGGYRKEGLDSLAAPVDGVLGEQIARLAALVDRP